MQLNLVSTLQTPAVTEFVGGNTYIRLRFNEYLLQAAICADFARAHSTRLNLDRLNGKDSIYTIR